MRLLDAVLNMSNEPPPSASERMQGVLWQAFCNNPNYTVLVRSYALGQFRIQLTDIRMPDPYAPPMHGSIVREMCTYFQGKAEWMTDWLCQHPEPELLCKLFETPSNCDAPGHGRIRLDDSPDDHPAGYRRGR